MYDLLKLRRAYCATAGLAFALSPVTWAASYKSQPAVHWDQTKSEQSDAGKAAGASHGQKLAEMQTDTDGTPRNDSFSQPEVSSNEKYPYGSQQAGQAAHMKAPRFLSSDSMTRDRVLSVLQGDTDGTPRGDSMSQPKESYANAPMNSWNLSDSSVPATAATDRSETRQFLAQNDPYRRDYVSSTDRISSSASVESRESSSDRVSTGSSAVGSSSLYSASAQSYSPHVALLESALKSALIQANSLRSQLGGSRASSSSEDDVSAWNAGATELIADLDAADVQKGEISASSGKNSDIAKSSEYRRLETCYRALLPVETSWRDRARRDGYWKNPSSVKRDLGRLTARIQETLNATQRFDVAQLDRSGYGASRTS